MLIATEDLLPSHAAVGAAGERRVRHAEPGVGGAAGGAG
jgi:hypothetical protein